MTHATAFKNKYILYVQNMNYIYTHIYVKWAFHESYFINIENQVNLDRISFRIIIFLLLN